MSFLPVARHPPRGFTLIELSVALTLLALMLGSVVVGIGALTGSKARAAAGELGGVIRSLYNTAALSGKTCRLVFELPGKKAEEGATRYRAECASGATTAQREREAGDKRRREDESAFDSRSEKPTLEALMAAEKNRVDNTFKYSTYSSPEIAPREIPAEVTVSVWTRAQRDRVRNGVVYLYFFPQGFTEKTQVYFQQGDNVWTVSVSPLTGKTSVVAEELEVPRS